MVQSDYFRGILCTLALLLGGTLSAQFGLAMFYNSSEPVITGLPANLGSGYDHTGELAAYYWFRLPKQRIEFQPTVYYAQDLTTSAYNSDEVGVQFKTNVYLFDLGTDCHCPTFGKQGPQLQKGLFLQISPGVANSRFLGAERRTVATLGAGIGLDIGISNLMTLTPLVSYRYTLTDTNRGDWQISGDDSTVYPDVAIRLHTFQLGLQATFRLDQRNY